MSSVWFSCGIDLSVHILLLFWEEHTYVHGLLLAPYGDLRKKHGAGLKDECIQGNYLNPCSMCLTSPLIFYFFSFDFFGPGITQGYICCPSASNMSGNVQNKALSPELPSQIPKPMLQNKKYISLNGIIIVNKSSKKAPSSLVHYISIESIRE